ASLRELAASPGAVLRHLRGLARGDAPRFVGHNPVAGWAMAGGLALVVVLAGTGVVVLAGEEGRGALDVGVGAGIAWHEVHGWIAWGVLAFIAVHLAGVAKESLRTRENLAAAMLTGQKRGDGPDARPFRGVGIAVLAGAGVFATAFALTPPRPARPLPDDATWRAACGECHLAFHPTLLPARSWARMMDEQADHFGEDLMLDGPTTEAVKRFLFTASADSGLGEHAWRVARSTPGDASPQRITELPWWEAVHADVVVDEPLRCDACHGDAEAGAFEDWEVKP
ncbi:MAG: cytochrome b/b6 domain-containing protein, partial [Myxococcota bacterium]